MREYPNKDFRKKSSWSLNQKIYLIKRVGILTRKKISIDLKRGLSYNSAKEELKRLGIKGEKIHGISNKEAMILGITDFECIVTQKNRFRYLVTWLELESKIESIKNSQIVSCIKAMAIFQKWIFEVKSKEQLHTIMRGYLNEK